MRIFDYMGEDGSDYFADLFAMIFYRPGVASGGAATDLGAAAIGSLPTQWQEITASDLGWHGIFWDETSGFKAIDAEAIAFGVGRARLFGKYDAEGNLESLNIAFSDAQPDQRWPDFEQALRGTYVQQFNHLLWQVAHTATTNGLSGEDVVVSGGALGALAAVNLFDVKDAAWMGFYEDAKFFTYASPIVRDDPQMMNFGFENDVLYRLFGEGSYEEIIAGFDHPNDGSYDTTPDNIVLFNDGHVFYGDSNATFEPTNVASWAAHFFGMRANIVEIISSSEFYDFMDRDSAIVVSLLSDAIRPYVVVEDHDTPSSSHYGDPAFILGGMGNDKLGDGASDDFLEGREGHDMLYLGAGNDIALGGAGIDKVAYEGARADYTLYKALDNTVFVVSNDRFGGVDELRGVEFLGFETARGEYGSVAQSLNDLPIYFSGFWEQWQKGVADGILTGGADYEMLLNGVQGDDTLRTPGGKNKDDAIYGGAGDDVLDGHIGDDLLLGGIGNDTLIGGNGDDRLVGGFGEDVLIGGAGDDVLIGGLGNDVFDFSDMKKDQDTVMDFNIHVGDTDRLLLSGKAYSSAQQALDAAIQIGDDVVIAHEKGTIMLSNVLLGDLTTEMFDIA
ncbi:MAG: calcium-binding protein [Alphaproteobacteria bacterium]